MEDANEKVGKSRDIIEQICSYLDIQTLKKAATVSRLWNEEAKREQMKRGLERIVIPVANVNVSDFIRVKPYVTLMFVSRNMRKAMIDDLWIFKVSQKYKNCFPDYFVILNVDKIMMDQEFITCNDELSEGGVLSLLIPKYRDLKIRAKCINDVSKRLELFYEFFFEDSQLEETFIIFTNTGLVNKSIIEVLKESMAERKKKFSIWGGSFNPIMYDAYIRQKDKSTEIRSGLNLCNFYSKHSGVFAMGITGSSLKSWSVVIKANTKKYEFDQKLSDFRDELQFKRRSIGLECGPHKVIKLSSANYYVSGQEMMDAVKKIFPDVPFIGIYDHQLSFYFGLKPKAEDPDQRIQHQMSWSLMILTFD